MAQVLTRSCAGEYLLEEIVPQLTSRYGALQFFHCWSHPHSQQTQTVHRRFKKKRAKDRHRFWSQQRRKNREVIADQLYFPRALRQIRAREEEVACAPCPPPARISEFPQERITGECPVCQEDNVQGVVLGCGHFICSGTRQTPACREGLYSVSATPSCPVCRHPLLEEMRDRAQVKEHSTIT